ncbi:unnamed protein product [Bursaphelenchus xylophilus]|uniref:(pine wood nematode) hypothetical protein n=1 Tax=Bursaphelenchus xylophilus TaxID=6326 RepID=A0A1I7RJD2_BURXY|nr:unnamed protein product [Bursaphelenchus xylophilus]CAG9128801.1 unnamed protein product [Bursaphelenchus xylophilus]
MVFLLVLLLAIVFICFYNFYYKRLGLPPGPTPWPILGNMAEIAQKPPGTDVFFEWRDKYGPVFTYWMGEKPVVAFADYKTLDQTFNKDGENFAGRDFFPEFYLSLKSYSTLGLTGMEGTLWKEHRAFIMRSFRSLGMTKSAAQGQVLIEISSMFQNIDDQIQAGVVKHDICKYIDLVIGNMGNIFLFGHGFSKNHHNDYATLRDQVHRYMAAVMTPAALLVMSHPHIFRHLPYFKGVYKEVEDRVYDMLCYMDRQIQEHIAEKENKAGSNDDYVSAFLEEVEKRDGKDGFTIPALRAILVDLWIGSQDATCTTLSWGVLYCVHYPDKQKKVQEELDRVVSSDRLVTLDDKDNLPYATAFCQEIQRLSNVVTQNLLHRNHRETTVNGFKLKAGTSIMGLITTVLYDPDVFENPKSFEPERFLDSEGRVIPCNELIPFSTGRRICPGEALAKAEIFLIFANLLNRYELRPVAGEPKPSLKRNFGFSVAPDPFRVEIVTRE